MRCPKCGMVIQSDKVEAYPTVGEVQVFVTCECCRTVFSAKLKEEDFQ